MYGRDTKDLFDKLGAGVVLQKAISLGRDWLLPKVSCPPLWLQHVPLMAAGSVADLSCELVGPAKGTPFLPGAEVCGWEPPLQESAFGDM